MARIKGSAKTGGRAKGVTNKRTALLKDAIIEAAAQAGNDLDPKSLDGLVSYLKYQAKENPAPFMALMGKVIPLQIQAQVNHKAVLTDAELEAIATASSHGTAETTESPRVLN